jgi:hypothetical protein
MIKGSHHSDESRLLLSQKLKGRKLSEETRRKMSESRRGKKRGSCSAETKKKISEALRGQERGPHSEERKAAISRTSRITRKGKGHYVTDQGYRKLTSLHDHPLAQKDGCIFEHIKVLYDKIGPGPHQCHWKCGRMLTWQGGTQLGICVDHLDRNRLNNDPDNLVPSCRIENLTRGWWVD